jgi:hypothetical protein
MRYLCVHGHFYQPPRENPWLEDIEVQDSAHPFHDWNQRITRECYAPNAASRVLDGRGRITDIVDNYRKISFNFGPTLLSWMERGAPEVYARVLEGTGPASAPGAATGTPSPRSTTTSSCPSRPRGTRKRRWPGGLADFEHRFGRKAEGLWLSETAVDTATLETLAARGIKFTILSPTQARRVRPLRRATDKEGAPAGDWHDVTGGRIDPSRPYLWRSSKGASIALFFYDSPISHAVAFEGLLNNGDVFADRLLSGFSRAAGRAATHAHRHGRGILRSPPPVRGHGAGLRPATDRVVPSRRPDELRAIPRNRAAALGSGNPRKFVVELRPRGGTLAVRLRLPVGPPRRAGPRPGGPRCATP